MSEVETPLREVRFRVAICFAIVMLSVDSLNPIKFLCSVSGIEQYWVAIFSIVCFIGIVYANAQDLLYFMVKVFLHSLLSIFFTSMEVIGEQNIPIHGPVIFTGNHQNQFVDAAMIVITNPHTISFLIAESSYYHPIVGAFARVMRAIPVSRPQDSAKPGAGKIWFDGFKVLGDESRFLSLNKGDRIRPGRSAEAYRIKEIISDTELILTDDIGEPSPLHELCQGQPTSYDVLGFIDQGHTFKEVHKSIAKGTCVGIFPEGGSHDNTDLLPLKSGISSIALGTYEKFGKSVPIVPVGLTYFRGDRFRGRVVVEYGEPIRINKDLVQLMRENKRKAYVSLLAQVEEGMRSVIVTAADYNELKLMHALRRLYQRSALSTLSRQDLSHRFATALRLLKEKYNGSFPADMQDLQSRIQIYQDTLDNWNLKDHQVARLEFPDKSKILFSFIYLLVVAILASVPTIFLNAPVGLAAKIWAETQAKKDLKKSRVKLQARDVVLTKKIMFCLVAVPTLWISYALLLYFFSSLEPRVIFALFICCPVFSYIGVTAMEAGAVKLNDLKPAFLRLLPGFRKQAEQLPITRAQLVKDVRAIVKKYGPELGPVYFEKSLEWEKAYKKA